MTTGAAPTARFKRRDAAAGAHGELRNTGSAKIEELVLELRRRRANERLQARCGEQLQLDEARIGDGEPHPADAAGLEDLEVDPFGEDGDLTAPDQRFVGRLQDHRVADREEGDHDADAEPESGEEEERAPGAEDEVAEGEGGDHRRGKELSGGASEW